MRDREKKRPAGPSYVLWLTLTLINVVILLFLLQLLKHREQPELTQIRLDTFERQKKHLAVMESTLVQAYKIPCQDARYHAWLFSTLVSDNNYRYKICIPWELLAATFWIESNMYASALSHANARGKAQVLQSTFEESCKRMGIPTIAGVSIWHDWLNASAGAEVLSRHYKKGYEFAIKAYYGGSKYVETEAVRTYFVMVDKECKKLQKIYRELYIK